MAKNNKNRKPNDFPLSTDPEFNSVVMEHEMTGAIPAMHEKNPRPYGLDADEALDPPYGDYEEENFEPPYGRGR